MIKAKAKTVMACLLFCTVLAACDSKEEKHQKYLNKGNHLFEQGEYTKARLEYKNAARIKPSDAEVRYRLALLDEAEGDMRSAFANYAAAEQQEAHFKPALIKLAQYLLAAGQYDECQKRLNTILQDAPQDPEGHALLAALHLRKKEFEDTEREARVALAAEAANVTAYTVLTGLYMAQQNPDKAAATVEEAIGQNPKNVPLLLLKAMVGEQSNNVGKVIEAYKVLFTLRPTEVRFRDDLAKVYLAVGNKDDAERTLRDGAQAMPDNWSMKKRLVAFLNDNRGMDVAEKAIKDLMAAYPDNEDLSFWLADLYLSNKADDRAIVLLELVSQQGKEDDKQTPRLKARTSLARIYFARGNKALAEKLVKAVLEKAPNNEEALFVRAQLLFDRGEHQEAVSTLRTIVRDNPKAAEAQQLLSETLLTQGHLDLAIDVLNQLIEAVPTNMAARVRLAQLYALRGDMERALELLGHVTKMEPSFPVGWETTARIAVGQKNWDLAESAIKTLESLPDQEPTGLFLRGQIASAKDLHDEAIALYIKVVEKVPTTTIAQRALSAMVDDSSKAGKIEAAVAFIRRLDMQTTFVLNLLGDCYVKLGNEAEAAAAYDLAIGQNASVSDPYLSRARLYVKDKKQNEALAVLDKAAGAVPGDQRIAMMRAALLIGLKRYPEAVATYERLLAHNPNMDVAANNAAQLISDNMYTDSQMLARAHVLAERFVRSANPNYLDTLAWVYYRLGDYQQGLTVMERVMAFDQKFPPQIRYHYGALLMKMGKTAEAKAQLTNAVESGADFPGVHDARAMMLEP